MIQKTLKILLMENLEIIKIPDEVNS